MNFKERKKLIKSLDIFSQDYYDNLSLKVNGRRIVLTFSELGKNNDVFEIWIEPKELIKEGEIVPYKKLSLLELIEFVPFSIKKKILFNLDAFQ